METGYLVSHRLKKLCESHCEDLALNLVTAFMCCYRMAETQQFNLNATEEQRWFIFDVYIALLFKFKKTSHILTTVRFSLLLMMKLLFTIKYTFALILIGEKKFKLTCCTELIFIEYNNFFITIYFSVTVNVLTLMYILIAVKIADLERGLRISEAFCK